LQSTPLAPVDNPRLRDLAGQITAGQTDSYQAALAVSHWVYQNLQKVESHPSPINALQILDQMRGDCSEHALLAAALCRAAGIPARMVTGLAAQRNKVYYHAWLEVYVGEWVELDPTWKENLVDAGHLRLADSDLDPLSFMRMNLETGRTLGALRLQVLDFQTVGG
jgi:transglutaminase-like putative cysteine protease